MFEISQLFGHDVTDVNFYATFFQHLDYGLARQAVQDSIWIRGVNFSVFDKEDIGARRFGHIAAVIHEERIGAALGLGGVFGHGADHVEACGFGRCRDCFG